MAWLRVAGSHGAGTITPLCPAWSNHSQIIESDDARVLSVCRLASSAVIRTLRLPCVRYEAPGSPGIEYRGDQGDPPGSLSASAGEAP